MNNVREKVTERRNQTLILVEGEHEKGVLLRILLKCFPEIPVGIEDIHVYCSDIYDLYHAIEKEYDENWYKTEDEINIPLLISRKENIIPVLDKRKFTNIILIFDYERHDNWYSDEKIQRMQEHFVNASEDGILYINYPMIEAYQHIVEIPDEDYIHRFISVTCKPGSVYKNFVHKNSVVWKHLEFYKRAKRYLCERVPTLYEEQAVDAVDRILTLSEEEKLIPCIDLILGSIISDNSLRNTLNHYFESDIRKIGYAKKQMDFWTSMRQMFLYITKLNIAKAWNIQMGAKNNDEVSLKAKYLEIDMQRILLTQNEASRDDKNGFIWVLCTCLMFLGEYKFFWKS